MTTPYRDGATRSGDVAITEAPGCPGKGPCSPRLQAPMRRVVVARFGLDVSG